MASRLVPALLEDVVTARREELRRLDGDSREHRRPDDSGAWLEELRAAVDRVGKTVGYAWDDPAHYIVTTDGERLDPRRALVELIACAWAWADAMGEE